MKKLLLMVLTALTSATVWAQSYTYSAPEEGKEYYLYNVETEGFICGGNDWGTHASVSPTAPGLKVAIVKHGDTYCLRNQSTNNGFDCDGGLDSWIDGQGRTGYDGWYFEQIEGTQTYKIYNTAAGAGNAWGVNSGTKLLFDSKNDRHDADVWAFILTTDYDPSILASYQPTDAEAVAAATTKDDDLTTYYPALSTDGFAKWTCFTTNLNGAFHINTWSGEGATDGSNMVTPFFERWVGGGAKLNPCKMQTTLSGLVPGCSYELSALFRVLYENGGIAVDKVNLFAGNRTVDVCENGTDMPKGKFGTVSVKGTADENGNLVIGVEVLDGTNASWVTWKDMKLTFLSAPTAEVDKEELTKTVGNANTLATEIGEGPWAAALADAITTAQGVLDNASATQTEVDNADAALKTALSAANSLVYKYTTTKEALDAQKALMDGTNIYDAEGFAAYEAAWTALNDKYEAGTLTNEEVAVNPNLFTGWHSSTAYNFLLTPWTIGGEACNEFDKALYINTWSVEGDTDGSNFQVPFFEYWTGDAESLANNTISTTVTDLENGVYEVTAWVRVRTKNGVAATDATGITLSANGTSVDATEGEQVGTSQFTLAEVTANCEVTDGTLTISLVIEDTNASWLSFKNVKYAKTGVPTSINGVETLTSGTKIYDLSGRQLQKLQKGVNIVNGVKVLK